MDYAEAMQFIDSTKYLGSRLGLESITALMHELGDVQDQVPVIHITGTNGKGSVGAMLSAVMTEAGYRVGRFASPAVFSYEEAFLMNGVPIEKNRLAGLLGKIQAACRRMTARGLMHPTSFEIETAAAFLWFYEEQMDVALVEVGMGGATDSTNVIRHPLASVIMSVSMDHMQFLGNTLEAIAEVKCGIIKEECPVITAKQKPEVIEVIRRVSRTRKAPLLEADEHPAVLRRMDAEGMEIAWMYPHTGECMEFSLGISGKFQLDNVTCALEVLYLLCSAFPKLTPETWEKGLAKVRWPGRFERIGDHPAFYLDGAHNEAAAILLRETLDICFPGREITYLMGVLADKEYKKIIAAMLKPGDRVFTLTPPNPRALDGTALAEYLKEQGIDAAAAASFEDGAAQAIRTAGEQGIVVAFGSLYDLRLVKDAYKKIMDRE